MSEGVDFSLERLNDPLYCFLEKEINDICYGHHFEILYIGIPEMLENFIVLILESQNLGIFCNKRCCDGDKFVFKFIPRFDRESIYYHLCQALIGGRIFMRRMPDIETQHNGVYFANWCFSRMNQTFD